MTLSAGNQLGAYQIVAPLGKGGMGEVYRATDKRLGRDVAIKILPEHLAQNQDAMRRLEREAKTLAALSHPNILTIHDVGTEHDTSFVVTELLEGETLRSRISRSALSWQKVLQIAIPIAEGLAAAHSKGVIHRDLKPENIFLTSDGRIKILDFGLARFTQPVSQNEITGLSTQSRATQSGAVMGTVPYMSPEQVRGESVDARTDIFSFGSLLYEMIAGRRPFTGNSRAEISAAILRDEPEGLASSVKEIPAEFDHVVTRCLEKNPEQRFQSASDLAFELREILSGSAVSKSVPEVAVQKRSKTTSYLIIAAALTIVALLIGLKGRFLSKSSSEPIHSLAVLPLQNLSGDPNQEYFADGMTEELIAKLARIESLRVISRTSVMEYKDPKKRKPLPQIAKELNVDAIIEGSVLQAGDRVRITAQLIHAPTDRHLWAESYERDMRDIFALQNEVASAVAREIRIKLTPQEETYFKHAPQVRPDAYRAYLRGLGSLTLLMGGQDAQRAVKMFERAVELDPSFAAAYSQLSVAHSLVYFMGLDRTKERLKMAKQAVDRAFQLKPDLPEGHKALGWYYYRCRDYDQALREFNIAQRYLRGDPEILMGISSVRRRQGYFNESLNLHKKALELAPREAAIPMEIAVTLSRMRKYSDAVHYCDLSISLEPDQTNSYITKARAYWQQGSTEKARIVLQEIPDQKHSEVIYFWVRQALYERNYQDALTRLPFAISETFTDGMVLLPWVELQGLIYYLKGEQPRARSSFESARVLLQKEAELRPDDHRVHSSLGICYAGLGRKEDAIREGKLAVQLYPISKDALIGSQYVETLTQIYVMVGDYDAALDQLDYLLSIPSQISVGWIRIDPRWDPLRNIPRFQELMKKYSQS